MDVGCWRGRLPPCHHPPLHGPLPLRCHEGTIYRHRHPGRHIQPHRWRHSGTPLQADPTQLGVDRHLQELWESSDHASNIHSCQHGTRYVGCLLSPACNLEASIGTEEQVDRDFHVLARPHVSFACLSLEFSGY